MPRAWLAIKSTKKREAGFSPVEVLLAATIFGMVVTAVVGALIYGQLSAAGAGDQNRAAMVAEEGLDAVRNIRDQDVASIVDGTYGLVQSGGVWALSGTSDAQGVYTRQVTISSVDSKRKTVTSNVTWPRQNGIGSVSLSARLTGWSATVISWLNAVQAGSYNAAGTGDGLKVATAGNYAYIVRSSSPNFVIIDISNPSSPSLAAAIDVANTPTNIAVSGDHAYITTSSNSAEMLIVNISNPSSPAINATYNAPGNGNGLAVTVVGNYAYLARAANGNSNEFMVVNISNPNAPVAAGGYNNNINMNDVVVEGDYAYVGTNSGTQELLLLNISNPAAPTLATAYNLSGTTAVTALAKYSNTLYLARGTGLLAMNVSNPLSATSLGTVTSTGPANINDLAVEASGAYVFMGTNSANAEFQVVDTSNPASMSVVRTVDVSPGTNNMNGVAYGSSLDIVVGVTTSDTQEAVTFVKN